MLCPSTRIANRIAGHSMLCPNVQCTRPTRTSNAAGRAPSPTRRMRLALYPGTFDPVTLGHLDVLERALAVFDRVEVTVAVNASKQTLFSADERVALVHESIAGMDGADRVTVAVFEGLLVDHARACGAVALVRGLRQVSDFDYEMRMAVANRRLAPGVQTVFFPPAEDQAFVAASIVRDIHRWGGDVASFVPPAVARALGEKPVASGA